MEDQDNQPTQEELARRNQWFNGYIEQLKNHSVLAAPEAGVSYRCPCCHYKTLNERGGYDICPVCFWEDDGQDDQDADAVRGGPNRTFSLTQARENFKAFGACDPRSTRHVRPPLPEEL